MDRSELDRKIIFLKAKLKEKPEYVRHALTGEKINIHHVSDEERLVIGLYDMLSDLEERVRSLKT